jgi:hypothetical protein
MKEKLEELRKQKNRLSDEYDAVSNEINRLENQLRAKNTDLYIGKWFYKEDSNWNEFDDEYTEYTFIFITEVWINALSNPNFSAIRIDTDTNYKMKEFSFRRDVLLTLKEIQEYTELSEDKTVQFADLLDKTLEELFILSPCLKEKIKNLFE